MTDPDAALVEEWAELTAGSARRVPDYLAADLLEWWIGKPDASPAVRAALGVRFGWLCTLNPVWRNQGGAGGVLPADLDAAWQTGTTPERATLLRALRRSDPGRAEALLRATWDADNADERRRFLERFEDNLSMADEPFLEWVLDDKSKQARAVASSFLARLPGSRLVQRMLDRAALMVRVEHGRKGILRRASETIVVEPPQEWDTSWERDGLEERPPGGVGKRAWWLQQVLSATPPQALADRLGIPRDRLHRGIVDCEYAKQALPAVCAAAVAGRDEAWCADLVRQHMADKVMTPELIEPLWKCLTVPAREKMLLEVVGKGPFDWAQRAAILGAAGHRWSKDFSAKVCRTLTDDRPSKAPDAWIVAPALDRIAHRIDPTSLPDFEKFIAVAFRDEPPPSAIKCLDLVRLRADMHTEFAQ